jgi:hypothetical protein
MDIRIDFSDVDRFIKQGMDEVKAVERETGDAFVLDAVGSGSYQDRTGNLRRSNMYEVDDDGVAFMNTAEYASFVEAKGFRVIKTSVLRAHKKLTERIG